VTRRRNGWGLALVAAFVLVLQSVLGTVTLERMPAFPQLDAFGNPLCISATHSDSGRHDDGHGQPADCCLLGCQMSCHLLAAHLDADWLLAVPVSCGARQRPPRTARLPARDHYPGCPRAPPSLIA